MRSTFKEKLLTDQLKNGMMRSEYQDYIRNIFDTRYDAILWMAIVMCRYNTELAQEVVNTTFIYMMEHDGLSFRVKYPLYLVKLYLKITKRDLYGRAQNRFELGFISGESDAVETRGDIGDRIAEKSDVSSVSGRVSEAIYQEWAAMERDIERQSEKFPNFLDEVLPFLTKTEAMLLLLLREGRTPKQIAESSSFSLSWVYLRRDELMTKLTKWKSDPKFRTKLLRYQRQTLNASEN